MEVSLGKKRLNVRDTGTGLGFRLAWVIREVSSKRRLCEKRRVALGTVFLLERTEESTQNLQAVDGLLTRGLVVLLIGAGEPVAGCGEALDHLGAFF